MKISRIVLLILIILAVSGTVWQVYERLDTTREDKQVKGDKNRSVPIIVEPVKKGPIVLERNFSGSLESHAEFFVSPKVGGIIENVSINMGDAVTRGQIIAVLDSAEYDQAVIQVEAEVEVAKANLQEARSLLKIAERELKRIDQLSERGVSSASQRDLTQADQLARQAHVQVTLAELARAKALLETAHIRREYTNVTADWHGDDEQRWVAERFVDEGETVNANTPLLKIVNLNPVTAVFNITEKEYADLMIGQKVSLTTDAYPGEQFSGVIERISPVFHEATRQARIEVKVHNPDVKLKPGMFVRAHVILRKIDNATIVPLQALTRRDDRDGLFLLSDDGRSVTWKTVTVGIRQGDRLQILADDVHGQVVILGQQLLKNGSKVVLPDQMTDLNKPE